MRKVITLLLLLCLATLSFAVPPQKVNASIIDASELVNSLEVHRETGFASEWDAACYVVSKYWLQSPINNRQGIIDFFDSRQWEDGAWGDMQPRAMTARAVLYAYFLLDARPKKSLDSFFSQYDTWEEALNYRRASSKYHLVYAWICYYLLYPPWMTDLFSYHEQNLDWTINDQPHERSHILYSYLIARRPYPNLDGIIEATLAQQYADGSWRDSDAEALAETAIQLYLLKEIMLLYSNHPRLSEMQNAINKAKPVFEENYEVAVLNGKRCGYFTELTTGTPRYDLDFLYFGILGSILSGATQGDTDPLFQTLYSRIVSAPASPSPTPTSSPSPSPSIVPRPSPSFSTSPSPSPSSSPQPIPTQKPQLPSSLSAEIIYPVAVGISFALIVTLTFLLRRKRHPLAKEHI